MKIKNPLLMATLSLIMSALLAQGANEQALDDLQAKVAALEKSVAANEQALDDSQAKVAVLEKSVAALQRQLTLVASNPALGLGPFVTVDPNPEIGVAGPNITFHGANIHIVASASGFVRNGLGNLIIGNDEAFSALQPGDRGGTSNLVVGRFHKFTAHSFLSVVFGEDNKLDEQGNVLGGTGNLLANGLGVVVGGFSNRVTEEGGVIVGGSQNATTGIGAVVLGGSGNDADGSLSVVLGGTDNSDQVLGTVLLGGTNINVPVGLPVGSGVIGVVTPPSTTPLP
jgi:hypothetical protein